MSAIGWSIDRRQVGEKPISVRRRAPEQDWIEAEREINGRIAEHIGVIERAPDGVSSLGELGCALAYS